MAARSSVSNIRALRRQPPMRYVTANSKFAHFFQSIRRKCNSNASYSLIPQCLSAQLSRTYVRVHCLHSEPSRPPQVFCSIDRVTFTIFCLFAAVRLFVRSLSVSDLSFLSYRYSWGSNQLSYISSCKLRNFHIFEVFFL